MAVEQIFISRLHSHHSLARWSEYARTTEDLCSLGDLLVVAFFVVDLEFFFFSFTFFLKLGSLSRTMVAFSLLSLSSSLSLSLSLSLLRGIRKKKKNQKIYFNPILKNETTQIELRPLKPREPYVLLRRIVRRYDNIFGFHST